MSETDPTAARSAANLRDRLCRDRLYPTRHVPDLPRTCCGLSIDYASEKELPVCRRLVLDSARRGDNVGLDEFEDIDDGDDGEVVDYELLDDSFSLLVNTSEVFVARDLQDDNDGPQAFIFIQPSIYTRTWDTCWATIHVFYSARLHQADEDLLQLEAANRHSADVATADRGSDCDGDVPLAVRQPTMTGIYGHLLQLGVEFVGLMELGYTDCMVAVADCCKVRVEAARRLGFVVIATIPDSVDVFGFGIRQDLLMAKCVTYDDRKRRTREVIRELANRSLPADRYEVMYRDAELHSVSFLPQRYVFESGLAVVVRAAAKDEDRSIYEMMTAAAEAGLGYGVDEFPTLDSFRFSMLLEHNCIVFENELNGELVGFTAIGKSWYVRTERTGVFESSLVIGDSYRGRGIGSEASDLELSLAVELGFRASVNDWLGSNLRMAGLVRRRQGGRVVIIGTIQRGAYTASPVGGRRLSGGHGGGASDGSWDDQVIIWNDVRAAGIPTFTEIAERSRARAAARGVPSSLTASKL